MKNLHIIPTDKPSRLAGSEYITNVQGIDKRVFKFKLWNKFIDNKDLKAVGYIPHNIYITSDEEIKKGDWMYYKHFGEDIICEYDTMGGQNTNVNEHKDYYKKIILTTDQDLIKDGVQAIDDEFLEWFVKNPSCEEVEVDETYPSNCCINKEGKTKMNNGCMERNRCLHYKIIIPKKEPEQFSMEADLYENHCIVLPELSKPETLEEANWKVLGTKNDTFYNGAKWQQEDMIEKLEMHILINEDDWNRNPQAQFRNFIEQFKKK